jgi:hypothetical protein
MAISRMQQPQQMQGGLGALDAPRQGYFLGKLVKKAVRGVKKVVKSPLGKMALLGGLGALGGSFMSGGVGTGLGRFSLANLKNFGGGAFGALKGGLGTGGKFSSVGDIFRVGGEAGEKMSIPRLLAGGLGATALAAPFLAGKEEPEEVGEVMDVANIRNRAQNFYSGMGEKGVGLNFMPDKKYVNQNFYAADGGRAGYANGMLVDDEEDEIAFARSGAGMSRRQPMAFLNMGGDAGNAGGFVAMGGEERADDVPARLSKNEFVFTADAVRNAGGGDIDRGSEVMQNLMDNLEQGGQVSEDSQGLGGEEIMSEEMIEEPNGAQAMYEQQQALQSRMA